MSRGLHIAALAWSIPGFAVQVYGLYAGQPFLAIGGAVFLVAGLMFYSKAKGYAPAWGLWGLVPVMGPIILVLQPHRAGSTIDETIDRLLIEEDPRIRATNRRETDAMSGGWPLLAIMTPIGVLIMLFCGGLPKATAPGIEAVPIAQAPLPTVTPPAPVPEPKPEPAPTPAAIQQPTAPPPAKEKPKSAEERYDEVKPGMTYEEICAIVGNDTTLISGKIGKDAIVKWRNPDKSYFAARFGEGRLDRMTHLVAPPLEKRNEEMRAELEPAPASIVSSTPGRLRPQAELPGLAEAEAEGTPSETMPVEEAPPPEDTNSVEEPAAKARKAVVRVGENVKPAPRVHKARFPKYTQTIGHGPHDVHIINPTKSDVRVGIRGAGKRGKDISIPSRGQAALYLDNGQYSVYYISDDYPEDLNNAGAFTVDSPPDAIVIVLH